MNATKTLKNIVASVLIIGATTSISNAQEIRYQPNPDSPIGTRNPAAPAGVAQFDFVIGDWDVAITWTSAAGETNTYMAKWHNRWFNDGFDVSQEWRGPYITGTEFRHYEPATDSWSGRNLYVGDEWRETSAKFIDGKMIVTIYGQDRAGNPQLNRETYFNIEPDTWQMKSELSSDNGETWIDGNYYMTATRVKAD